MRKIDLLNQAIVKTDIKNLFQYLSAEIYFQITEHKPNDSDKEFLEKIQKLTTSLHLTDNFKIPYSVSNSKDKATLLHFLKQNLIISDDEIELIESPIFKAYLYDLKGILHENNKYFYVQKMFANIRRTSFNDLETWFHTFKIIYSRALFNASQIKVSDIQILIKDFLHKVFFEYQGICLYEVTSIIQTLQQHKLIEKHNFHHILEKLQEISTKTSDEQVSTGLLCQKICNSFNVHSTGAKILFESIHRAVLIEPENYISFQRLMYLKKTLERGIPKKERNLFDYYGLLKEIERKITHAGKDMVEHIKFTTFTEIDVRDIILFRQESIKNKKDVELLIEAIRLQEEFQTQIINYIDSIIKQKSAEPLFFSSLFSDSNTELSLTSEGKVAAEGLTPSKKRYQLFTEYFNYFYKVTFSTALESCLKSKKLDLLKAFTADLVIKSNLVSDNQKEIVTLGLNLGFEKKYIEAIHILVPQFEAIIRKILNDNGITTTVTEVNSNVQNEKGLSTLMDTENITKILGENLVFEIQALFTEGWAFNLRNRIAHGLIRDTDLRDNSLPIYVWLFFLRFLLLKV